jgi:hypothetical protein
MIEYLIRLFIALCVFSFLKGSMIEYLIWLFIALCVFSFLKGVIKSFVKKWNARQRT